MSTRYDAARNYLLTRILPDQRYREHQEGQPHHQSHTAFGTSLFSRRNVIGTQPPTNEFKKCRRTLDGRIVLIHEVALNELDRQGRFADTCHCTHDASEHPHPFLILDSLGLTTTADNDELVLSQELGRLTTIRSAHKLEPTTRPMPETHLGHGYT